MSYPSAAEYNLAIRYIGKFVSDPVLKTGVPRSRNGIAVENGGEPLSYPGGFAKVYKVDCGTKTYALRVWMHEVSNAAKRYHATADFLKKNRLPFFVEHFEFVPNGILAGGQRYPILRMEWVEGYSLGEFIKQNLNQPILLQAAADAFAAMAAELHRSRVVHGDLQSENVVVRVNNGTVNFKLIDYDTLVVPALLAYRTISNGLASYQHPNRSASETSTEKDDYFSELVIYTTLCALVEEPELWVRFPEKGREKELLFEAADFAGHAPSALFQRLFQCGGNVKALAIVLWNFTRCPNISLLLPLEKVIDIVAQPTAVPPRLVLERCNTTQFDALLKSKLGAKPARNSGLLNSWLDDSGFFPPDKRTVPPEIPFRESPSIGATPAGTFEETFNRMRMAPITPASLPKRKSRHGVVVAFCIIAGLVALLLLSKCDSPQTESFRNRDDGTPSLEQNPSMAERIYNQRNAGQPSQPGPIGGITSNQGYAEGRLSVGDVYISSGRTPEAATAYRQAVELDPSNTLAWEKLGHALASLDQNRNAIDAYERAVNLNHDLSDAWYRLARLYASDSADNQRTEKVCKAIVQLRRLGHQGTQDLIREWPADFVQRLAVSEYPSLGELGSPLNREFVKRYRGYKSANPAFFEKSDWPLVLAQEAARGMGQTIEHPAPPSTSIAAHVFNAHGFCIRCGWERDFVTRTNRPCIKETVPASTPALDERQREREQAHAAQGESDPALHAARIKARDEALRIYPSAASYTTPLGKMITEVIDEWRASSHPNLRAPNAPLLVAHEAARRRATIDSKEKGIPYAQALAALKESPKTAPAAPSKER